MASPPSSTTSCGPLAARDGTAPSRCSPSTPRGSRPSRRRPGTPAWAMAAAAWSWVEKMLHEAQRTEAPSSTRVSMSTAVWIVMCREPVMRTPLSGFCGAELPADGHEAGHLVLGDVDLLAAPVGEGDVLDVVILRGVAADVRWHGVDRCEVSGSAGSLTWRRRAAPWSCWSAPRAGPACRSGRSWSSSGRSGAAGPAA